MTFELPKLEYSYDALEPFLSENAVRYHYDKHTKKYFDVANELARGTLYEGRSLESLISKDMSMKMESKFFNNVCQAWNHVFFWQSLAPANKSGKPSDKLLDALTEDFLSIDDFKKAFEDKGTKHFGSGWVWLVLKSQKLQIRTTPNAGTPLTEAGCIPLVVCDLWEHAYYLDYQHERNEYLNKFWYVIDWSFVNRNFESATKRS